MNTSPLDFLIPHDLELRKGSSDYTAQVRLTPLESGFGHTLGNALRRVLLAHIPGYAVTEVQFTGIAHEYVTNKNIEEDMVEVLLNLKQLAFQSGGEKTFECSIKMETKTPRVITAGDIKLAAGLEVINKDLVLAHLVANGKINASLKVEYGRGYRPAAKVVRDSSEKKNIGTLCLDASFSPIARVAYRVESARKGDRTDLDCLILDLETNGTVTAEVVVRRASTILWQHFQPLIEKDAGDGRSEQMGIDHAIDPRLKQSIDVLAEKGITMRIINALKKEGLLLVGDLVRFSDLDLTHMPNIGKSSIEEIKFTLSEMGLDLGMEIPDWPNATGDRTNSRV